MTDYVRISDIIGRKAGKNPARYPGKVGMLPISASAWWAGVKAGKYPRPVKLGPKTSVWRRADIVALAEGGA